MNLKLIFVAVAIGFVAVGCSSYSPAASPGAKILVKGADSSALRILIRQVDDGPLLWVGRYKMGTKVRVAPGNHEISVMCVFYGSGMKEMLPGSVKINAVRGNTYLLSGSRASDGNTCKIKVEMHA
ncbi:MAG: hypothetical protein ACRES9_07020 [Gammaproteobacteria bacterium]